MGFGMKLQKKFLGRIAASHGFWENCLSILCINCSHTLFAYPVNLSIFAIILLVVAPVSYAQILARCNLANIDPNLLAAAPAPSGQRFTLTPFLSVGERFDDNIFQTFRNRENDFITVVSPGICADYVSTAPTPDTDFHFKYQANIESFAKNSSQNQVSHQGALNFSSQLTPALSLKVTDTLVITDEPLERVGVADQFTSLRPASQQGRSRTSTNIATSALDVQLGQRATLGLVFSSILNNVNTPSEADETSYSVGAKLGYLTDVARRSMGYLSYLATFHTFQSNGPVTPGDTTADFQVHNVQVGFRHEFTPTLSGSFAVGPSFITSKDPKLDGDTDLAVNLEVIKTLSIGQASLNYIRSITSGGGQGEAVTRDTLRLAFFAAITGKLTAALSTNLSYLNYRNLTASSIVTNGGDRFAWAIGPSLSYQILRPWRLSASYAYEFTDFTQGISNVNLANISDHRFAVISQFALRQWLFLDVSYRYTARHLSNGLPISDVEPYYRNEVLLRLIAAPSFLF